MAVNIDPSEVRNGTSKQSAATPRLRLPTRTLLIGGLGGAGLLAFSVGAFSFFSTLADPRARTPRPMQAAASMPDLKDGMPVLVNGDPAPSAPKAAVLNLPRPDPTPEVSEPASAPAPAPLAEPAPVPRPAASEPSAPAPRAGPTPPQIQNAATVPETRTVTPVAPPARTAATIAPARTETVKAKPVQAAAVLAPQEPMAEPTSTATAVAPEPLQPTRKAAAAKPPATKAAARKTAAAKTVADAEPAAAPAAASAPADDSDIPGARQFRAGVKAIGGFFGGDAKDD